MIIFPRWIFNAIEKVTRGEPRGNCCLIQDYDDVLFFCLQKRESVSLIGLQVILVSVVFALSPRVCVSFEWDLRSTNTTHTLQEKEAGRRYIAVCVCGATEWPDFPN